MELSMVHGQKKEANSNGEKAVAEQIYTKYQYEFQVIT